jgi:hypothetical protein
MQILILALKDMDSLCNRLVRQLRIRSTFKRWSKFNKAFGSYYHGNVVGEWGVRKWIQGDINTKQNNIHIARQSLRMELLNQLGDPER